MYYLYYIYKFTKSVDGWVGQWLGVLLAFSTAELARLITDHRLAFSMVEPVWMDGRTDERTNGFFIEKSRGQSLSFLWFFALRLASSGICWKKKKRVIGFKFLGFSVDGFGVKEKKKKKKGTSRLCPTITGTHSL